MMDEADKQRLLILSSLIVELVRPSTSGDGALSLHDKLVANGVMISTLGPHRMGLNRIAETCSLPRTTVRRSLAHLMDLGRVVKHADGSYTIEADFLEHVAVLFDTQRKRSRVRQAATAFQKLRRHEGVRVRNGPQYG